MSATTTATRADGTAGDELVIDDVSLAFGGNWALDGVSFSVPQGCVFGIVGPNGAGKTSLLNCINGFYRPQSGRIAFEGQTITGLRPNRIAHRGIGRTFQNVELFKDSNTLDNIMLGRHLHMRSNVFAAALHWGPGRREEARHRRAVEEVIKFLEIEDLRKRPVAKLPWGMQKLVEIGRALAMEPRLLLLDEPTSGMNREEKEDVARAIVRMKHEMGITQVLIEHDMRFVSDLCDQVVVLDFGQVIAAGTPAEISADAKVIEAYIGTGVSKTGGHAMTVQDEKATTGEPAGGPLRGIRVVEVTKYVQGPVAGLVLASLGAEVTKIELVGRQDSMRSVSMIHGVELDDRGRSWLYGAVNRGKRALALDVTSASGRRIFHQLLTRADVFLTNLRSDGLHGIGADLEAVQAVNPAIVYAQGGGLGFDGPLASDPCQDTIGMAFSGFMDVTSPTEEPNYPPGSMSDVLTGTNLASAVMAGLLERQLHGKGGLVRTSQLQSLLWMQLLPVGMLASIGERMARFVREDTTPLYSAYPTADGWIAIAVIHPHQWPPLARVLGLDWALEDPRFARFSAIDANKQALAALFEATFKERTAKEWWALLREAGVWCAPVNRLEDLPTEPQVLANEYLVPFPDGFTGSPVPFEVNGWRGARPVAGAYSEHTDDVLAELGFNDQEILELRAEGTVW